MNREDIIRMAREAGMRPNMTESLLPELERFAQAAYAAGAAAEREACAQVCERDDSMRWAGAAEAIRTRRNK